MIILTLSKTTSPSDNTQLPVIAAIYCHHFEEVVGYWEKYIGASLDNPDVTENELAQFRGQVSNPDDVRQFVEYLDGEGEVEEGEEIEEGEEREEGDDEDDEDNDESDEDDEDDDEGDEDDEDEDENMGDFVIA
jgi:hypothetical protein